MGRAILSLVAILKKMNENLKGDYQQSEMKYYIHIIFWCANGIDFPYNTLAYLGSLGKSPT
jgi:hypothetical protein